MITRHDVARKLTGYLRHQLSLAEIVDWAERAMLEGEFDEDDFEIVREVVSRLGLADVNQFSLTWEDWENFLTRLGYQVQVQVQVLEIA